MCCGYGSYRSRIKALVAVVAGHHGRGPVAAGKVFDVEWFVAGPEDPFVAPLAQCGEDRPERPAFVGEYVVVATASLVIGMAFEYSAGDECVEAGGEHVAGDAESLDEVLETPDPEKCVADDEQCPPISDDLERLGDRAVDVGKRSSTHMRNPSPRSGPALHIETQV